MKKPLKNFFIFILIGIFADHRFCSICTFTYDDAKKGDLVDRYETPNKDDVARVYQIFYGAAGEQDVRVAVFSVEKRKRKPSMMRVKAHYFFPKSPV